MAANERTLPIGAGYHKPGSSALLVFAPIGSDPSIRPWLEQQMTKLADEVEGSTKTFKRLEGYTFACESINQDGFSVWTAVGKGNNCTTSCYELINYLRGRNCVAKGGAKLMANEFAYFLTKPAEANKLLNIEQEVKEVQGILMKNLETVIDRGDRIGTIEDLSEELLGESIHFRDKSKEVRCKMFNRAWKATAICVCVAILVVVVLGGGGYLLDSLGLLGKLFSSSPATTTTPTPTPSPNVTTIVK
jgi:hypothetical protein